MLGSYHRSLLRRVADVAMVAAFLALAAAGYGAFFVGAGRILTAPGPVFSEFYEPGRNPFAGPVVAPVPPQDRFASMTSTRHRFP